MDALAGLERRVLAQLAMLSEGSTANLDGSHSPGFGSEMPPGVGETDFSLVLHYAQLFARAAQRGFSARLTAIAEACRDYDVSIKRPPAYISPDSEQNERERDEAVLRWAGYRPEWPAVYERCSIDYVTQLRRKHKRDPMLGEQIEHPEPFAA